VAVPAIPAGQAVTVNLTGDTSRFAPGNYTLNVTVDYGSAVSESNESNNHLARSLSILEPVTKRAVLSVGEIFFAGSRREGEKVDIIVSIGNTGDATALNVVVTFVIDGKVAATQNLDQIASGTSRNATLTWTFAPGDHTTKAVVSSTGLSDVSGERALKIESAPSDIGNYLLAAGLAMILLLVAVVLVWVFRRPRQPGPKVRLVEEEE
jgi:subtilase family serine protease